MLIQGKGWVERPSPAVHPRFAVVEISPFVKEIRAESGAPDRFEKLFRQNRIRIDIGAVERHDQGIQCRKGSHRQVLKPRHIDEATRNRCRRGHRGTHQVRTSAETLASLEVAI